MIKVCDAIMGTGKSSAAITYMNEHPEDKFIYVTPYLEEAARIREGCPALHFIEPSDKIEEFHFRKCEHAADLIKRGRNITTTHQAFKMYNEDMLRDIREFGYTLIIDENMNVLEKFDCSAEDIRIAVDAGYVRENDDETYTLIRDDYNGVFFREMFRFLKVRELITLRTASDSGEMEHLFYWVFPPNLMTSFKDVFILTYLFEGQGLHHFLEMYSLPYKYIGIQKREDGTFAFSDYPGYTPDYVHHLKDMIHIVDDEKLNAVGNDKYALSMGWFEKNQENEDGVARLKRNVYNCINNIWRGVPSRKKLCGAFNKYTEDIRGKGYTKSFLSFNARATNAYRKRQYLVYVVNIFANVGEKLFYRKHGIEFDDDTYALSIMIQWIWRSAIRDGEEINIYIPSQRMRTLLTDWIEKTSRGGGAIE